MAKGISDLQKNILLMALSNTVSIRDCSIFDAVETKAVLNTLFSKTDNKARATVSRTFNRLEDRGLCRRFYLRQVSGFLLSSGIELTRKGIETAKNLKQPSQLPQDAITPARQGVGIIGENQ